MPSENKYKVEFRVNGNDANVSKLTSMITGIASQTDDKSLQAFQTMLVVATTERPDVYKILQLLAAASSSNGLPKPRTYKKQTQPDPEAEPKND